MSRTNRHLPISLKTTGRLGGLLVNYQREQKPLPVSIRELVPEMPYNSQRFTHGIHFYPAKLIPQIPALFLDDISLPKSATIMDPFCGSGTVLLEAVLRGYRAVGADSNPLARLISQAKTCAIPDQDLEAAALKLPNIIRCSKKESWPNINNIKYWFLDKNAYHLARIRAVVEKEKNIDIQRILWVTLSQVARKLSFCDLRVSVPVRLDPTNYPENHPLRHKANERLEWLLAVDPIEFFISNLQSNFCLVKLLQSAPKKLGKVINIYDDSCSLTCNSIHNHSNNSIDLIITSPPYAGAQKYVRASSIGLGWTGLCESPQLRSLHDKNIGREHFAKEFLKELPKIGVEDIDSIINVISEKNLLRAKILNSYFIEMESVINQCKRVLSKTGFMILIAGANNVSGIPCDTPGMLLKLAKRAGFQLTMELVDGIRSRGLMTRRNKTASTITCEHIYVLNHAD